MAFEVNLVSKDLSKIGKTNKTVSSLQLAAKIIMGVILLVIVGVFGWFFFNSTMAVRVDNQVDDLLAEVADKSETEFNYRLFVEVLSSADEVISKRKDFQGILLDIYTLLPQGSIVQGVNFGENVVLVQIKANGVQEFDRAVGVLRGLEGGSDRFSSVVLSSVNRTSEGFYNFRVELGIAQGEI